MLDGLEGCADAVDVGEHISSTPLVTDLTGDGTLEIVLGTLNGQVMAIDTGESESKSKSKI